MNRVPDIVSEKSGDRKAGYDVRDPPRYVVITAFAVTNSRGGCSNGWPASVYHCFDLMPLLQSTVRLSSSLTQVLWWLARPDIGNLARLFSAPSKVRLISEK